MFGRVPEKVRRPTKASAVGGRQQACAIFPHLPLAEKVAHTLNRAGKRTRRPERVVTAAGGLGGLDCGAGCDVCSGAPGRHRCGRLSPP